MKKISTIALYSFLALALAFGLVALPARAADHLDGPMAKHDGRLDITDVYAFKAGSNTVLIMNVDPGAGVLSPTTFHPDASYDIKIDTNGDAKEDITYKVTFSAVSNGTQSVQLRRVPARGGGAVLARGQTGANIPVSGGGMLRAGVFDDPFFFDLVAFRNGLAFCPGGVGTDFFLGLNVASIVLEVPSSSLGTNIGVWASTTLGGQQIDRMGRPAINTVFEHTDAGKDAFNSGIPRNDQRDFHQDVFDTLIALGNTPAYAEAVTNILLPDILTFNTSSSAGFLNGRQLADDVIDTELFVISNGAVTTDCVANDSTFSNTFPYLGSAN
jgi:hypothetical protein